MATIEEQRAQLVLLEAEREQVTTKMAKLVEAFVEQLAAELPDRWNDIARGYVKGHPDKVKDLGEDGIAKVKAKLADLEALSLEVAAHYLNGPKVWQHEVVRTSQELYNKDITASADAKTNRTQVSDLIAEAEREADNIISTEFGLETQKTRWRGDQGVLSEDLERIISDYEETDGQLREVLERSSDLEREISQGEAVDLWDSV